MRLMSKSEFLIVPKGTKFAGPGKLGLTDNYCILHCMRIAQLNIPNVYCSCSETEVGIVKPYIIQ